MAIGERIRFIRNLRGMTQKTLGLAVGFPERAADIRMAQYESGTRTPKGNLIDGLAYALGISPLALSVPNIDSYLGLVHTLFALEDIYGLTIGKDAEGEICLTFKNSRGHNNETLLKMLNAWKAESDKYKSGEISKEAYDDWRYNFPLYDTTQKWARVPSQQFSDSIVELFKNKRKN